MKLQFVRKTLTLGAVLFLFACEREVPQTNLGPQVSAQDIFNAQNKSLSRLDPYTIKKGQRVHKTETQEILSGQGPLKQMTKEWVTTVVEMNNEETFREIVTLQEVSDIEWEADFIYEFKNVYYLQQIDALRALDTLNQNSYQLNKMIEKLRPKELTNNVEVTGVAFHNLQTRKVPLSPPQLVKNGPDCKGIKGCRMDADLITYDVVFQMSDSSIQKHTVEWYVSPDAPYFAGIMKQCATTLLSVESARVLLKQCEEVVDFDF